MTAAALITRGSIDGDAKPDGADGAGVFAGVVA
jgi:hypothetical protein